MPAIWELSGKTTIVTGASQGIGFASAMTLAGAGADVAIVARWPDILHEARHKLVAETGATVIAIPGDVADPSFPQKADCIGVHKLKVGVVRKSVVASTKITSGTQIEKEDIAFKRSLPGLSPLEADKIIGKTAKVNI